MLQLNPLGKMLSEEILMAPGHFQKSRLLFEKIEDEQIQEQLKLKNNISYIK